MAEVKLKEITQVAAIPIGRRLLARHLTADKAYELINQARITVREIVEDDKDDFSDMYFYYQELCYPSDIDVRSIFSEDEVIELAIKLLRITE